MAEEEEEEATTMAAKTITIIGKYHFSDIFSD